MKNWGNAIVKDVKSRGWIEVNGTFYAPNSPQVEIFRQNGTLTPKQKNKRSKVLKTGWIDDDRNLKNREKITEPFMLLVKQELKLEVWPEFFFSTDRLYRIDYAIPILLNGDAVKIAIEQEGGIWAKGNSGHSSGTGIKRDMDKNNLLQSLGWRLIRRTPSELMTNETLELIKKML